MGFTLWSVGRLGPSLLVLAALAAELGAQPVPAWPPLEQQLRSQRVIPGSAFEALIRDNQDFGRLHPTERHDRIPVPLWLRVHWRRAHPGTVYSPDDPMGGYPHVLKEIHEWMSTHQDLRPGLPEADTPPEKAFRSGGLGSGGTNARISGAQPRARSESDIRVNPWNPRRIVAASNNIGGSGLQGQLYSKDGGATWGQTLLPLMPGDAFHADPSVDWTSDGTAWATTLGINSTGVLRLHAYKSTDGGATWMWDAKVSGTHIRADKPRLWADHGAASPWRDHLYACWHNSLPQYVNRRTAAGWDTPRQISGAETVGTAMGCDVKTNAAGDVFVFWTATVNRRLLLARSTDGGASFGAPVTVATTFDSYDIGIPAFYQRRALIYVSGGAYKAAGRNMVYASWTDLSGEPGCTKDTHAPDSKAGSSCTTRIWLSRSTDGGSIWSAPVRLHHKEGRNDQFNPWMVVDETNGQLAIVYYDTVEDAGRKKTHLYYQASFDDGVTWTAPLRVTSAPTDEADDDANLNQFGDYNGLSGHAGSFWPSWTDRRADKVEEIWTANIVEANGSRTAAADFYTLPPCRAVDTRRPAGVLGGPALEAGAVRRFELAGTCGVPAAAGAVAVQVTIVPGAFPGFLQVYPGDVETPLASLLNWAAGEVRSNNAIVPLAGDGFGTLAARTGSGPVHLVLDVVGYFQ